MPSLLKKKKVAKAAPAAAPRWHPNFRNFERLPDIKVVRTAFFVNGVAIVVALSLLLYFGYQEYTIHGLKQQVAYWEGQIQANRAASEQAVRQFQQFQAEAKKIDELNAFVSSDLDVTGFLLELGRTLPKGITLSYADLRPAGAVLRGMASGTPDAASGLVSSYLDQIKSDPVFQDRFSDVTLANLNRDAQGGGLTFEIDCKAGTARKKGEGK